MPYQDNYHIVFQRISNKKSILLVVIFFIFIGILLWVSNLYLNTSTAFRIIRLKTQTILSRGGIAYILHLFLIIVFFLHNKKDLGIIYFANSRKFYIGLKVFLISIFLISIWEWSLSRNITVLSIFDGTSPRVIVSAFLFGYLVALVEELTFKQILLVQLIKLIGEENWKRRFVLFLVSILFGLSHISIQLVAHGKVDVFNLVLAFLFSYFTSILYLRLRNLPLVLFLHFFLNIPVIFLDGNLFYFISGLFLISIFTIPIVFKSWIFKCDFRIPNFHLILPILLFISVIFAIASPRRPIDYYNMAQEYYEIENYEQAIGLINQAILMDSVNWKFFILRDKILKDIGEPNTQIKKNYPK